MPHLVLEIAIWAFLAFFVGCLVGYALRAQLMRRPTTAPADGTVEPGPAEEPATPRMPLSGAAETSRDSAAARTGRPKGIAQARGGKADNLQRISGIGPKNERTLHSLGFFHFDQIAAWSDEEVAWVDDHLKFNGRVIREEWILQAGLLAEGKEEEFERLYGSSRGKRGSAGPH